VEHKSSAPRLINDFGPDEVQAWLDARCFNSGDAYELKAAGVTPAQASTLTGEGLGEYVDTLGYKVSNSDLSVEEVLAILAGGWSDT